MKKKFYGVLALFIAATPALALAEQNTGTADAEKVMDEVVVTATRSEETSTRFLLR